MSFLTLVSLEMLLLQKFSQIVSKRNPFTADPLTSAGHASVEMLIVGVSSQPPDWSKPLHVTCLLLFALLFVATITSGSAGLYAADWLISLA